MFCLPAIIKVYVNRAYRRLVLFLFVCFLFVCFHVQRCNITRTLYEEPFLREVVRRGVAESMSVGDTLGSLHFSREVKRGTFSGSTRCNQSYIFEHQEQHIHQRGCHCWSSLAIDSLGLRSFKLKPTGCLSDLVPEKKIFYISTDRADLSHPRARCLGVVRGRKEQNSSLTDIDRLRRYWP